MKKRILTIIMLFSAASLISLSSCRFNCVHGSGRQSTETRKVSDFTKIDVSISDLKVVLKQDSSSTVTINADDNLLKYIKTSNNGGKLKISSKRNLCNSNELVIIIGVRNLEEVVASGAVKVETAGKLITEDLHFDLSGATKLNADLNAANVTTDASGASKIILTGQAASHHIDLSGASKLTAFDFVVGDYTISTSGVSKCQINVVNSLSIESSGASSIQYRGNPKTINNDKSGASSLKKVD